MLLQKCTGLLRIDTPAVVPWAFNQTFVSTKDVVLRHHYPAAERLPFYARDQVIMFVGHGMCSLYEASQPDFS